MGCIVIMAGGTGGHIFPALAVAKYLIAEDWQVSWIGTKQGMESHLIPDQKIEIDWLSVKGIRGKGLGAKINSVFLLLKACFQALSILRQRKPDVVLGMGGYVAYPAGLMASLMGIPLIIHEQNRIPGTTNRLLARRANKVLQAFESSFSEHIGALVTGNPLSANFLNLPEKEYWTTLSNRPLRILVVGGSQGAKILNETVPITAENLQNAEIKHQTGTVEFASVLKKYQALSIKAEVFEFIEDMAMAYQWADAVICRAGAMTVSEIAASGLPAIFIPLPQAIDDHQTANAKYLVDAGAGVLLSQSLLNADSLLIAINQLKPLLKKMSRIAKNKAKLDSTAMIATICKAQVK